MGNSISHQSFCGKSRRLSGHWAAVPGQGAGPPEAGGAVENVLGRAGLPGRRQAGGAACHTRAGTCPGLGGGPSLHLVVLSPRQHLGFTSASRVSPWSGSRSESTFRVEVQTRPSSTSSRARQLGTAHHTGPSRHTQAGLPRPGARTQAGTQGAMGSVKVEEVAGGLICWCWLWRRGRARSQPTHARGKGQQL